MLSAGQRLRQYRESRGLTLREVETASQDVARQLKNEEFLLGISTLSDIESKGVSPTIFRMQSLAIIYKVPYSELLSYYGICHEQILSTKQCVKGGNTVLLDKNTTPSTIKVPTGLDPAFDPGQTMAISRMVSRWGAVPFAFLENLAEEVYSYGYIGLNDISMYPILLPGSFVQIDEKLSKVQHGAWNSELERPIYFIESRKGFYCSWCSVQGSTLVLQPHPRSSMVGKAFRYPQDAEVLGQVVGVAMRLDGWSVTPSKPAKEQIPSNGRARLLD
jgi:transcriptional regulator with XRE-family HTH domain